MCTLRKNDTPRNNLHDALGVGCESRKLPVAERPAIIATSREPASLDTLKTGDLLMVRVYAERFWQWLSGRTPPQDPYSSVRQPVRRGPPSLNAAVALDEPTPRLSINLLGRVLSKKSSPQD